MPTPNPKYDLLKYDDKLSYDFILDAQGQEAADFYLEKTLGEYQSTEAAQSIIQQQEEIKKDPTKQLQPIGITPEDLRMGRQTAAGFTDPGRQLPGLTTGGELQQVPTSEIITLRRENIPSPYDIQTQAEQVSESIRQQQSYLGLPTYKQVEDQIFAALKKDYERMNGPLSEKFEYEQAIIEYDLRAVAAEKARTFDTADKFATSKIDGEFGVGRARQAGSPYESPPTPGGKGGQLLANPESAKSKEWMVDLNPFWEGETDLGWLSALGEALMPQTIVTPEQVQQQKSAMERVQQNFVDDVAKDLREEDPDEWAKLQRMTGSEILIDGRIEAGIEQRFKEHYLREFDRLYRQFKQEGMLDGNAQERAKAEATNLTRAQIVLIPDKYPLLKEKMETEYGQMKEIERSGYALGKMTDVALAKGGEGLQYLATSENPYTGELTESVGMAVIRDLNLPFRLVLNPLEEVMEMGAGGTSGQYVGNQWYDMKTYDFTEDVSGFFPTMDAYLREVAVETARGYGLGNAMANYNMTESGSDGYMIGGTVAEILIPWGAVAKGGQKLATTAVPLQKIARSMDLGADAAKLTRAAQVQDAPVYEVMKAMKPSESFGYLQSSYSMNSKIAGEAARQMEALDAARQYLHLVSDGSDASLDAANRILTKMDSDPLQKSMFQRFLIGIDDVDPTDPLQRTIRDNARRAIGMDRLLEEIAKQDTIYGDMAKQIVREGRISITDYPSATAVGQRTLQGTGGTTMSELVEVGAQRLSKYNIEDYVAFTDRMAINSEVLKEYMPLLEDITKRLYNNPLGQFDEFMTPSVVKLMKRDGELARIVNKLDDAMRADPNQTMLNALDPKEQIYLTNRLLEDGLHVQLGIDGKSAGAFRVTKEAPKQAMQPEQLRSERGARPIAAEVVGAGDVVERTTRGQSITRGGINASVAAARYVDEAVTAGWAGNTMREVGKKMKLVAPTVVESELVQVRRAVDAAQTSVLRLEQALPETMSRFGRFTTRADEAIYSMYVTSGKVDPTDILKLDDAAAKQLFQAGKTAQLTQEEVLQIMRGVYPTINAADEAFIISQLPTEGIGSLAAMERFAIQVGEEIPRIKTGMVGRPVLGSTIPDVGKVMVAISGNNAAKTRVIQAARAELSPLTVPVHYRTPQAEKFIYDEAMKYLETGIIEDSPFDPRGTLKGRASSAGLPQVVEKLEIAPGASPEQAAALRRRFMVQSDLENDIFDLANQLRAKGLELNLTPQQVQRQIQNNVEAILGPETGQMVTGFGMTEELAKLRQLYSEPETFRVLSSNVEELANNNPGLLNWTRKTLGLTAGDIRRSFVAGELGGKYVPNTRYASENMATQMLLSSITAPGANRLLFKPFVSTSTLTPTSKVRTLARDAATKNQQMPGSRYTYAQVNDALTSQNLGATSQTINMGDVFLEDMIQTATRAATTTQLGNIPYFSKAVTEVADAFRYMGKNPGWKSSSSSPAMRFASETDYAFREQLFIGALADGKTIDEAAQLARTAFFDYGNLPAWTKESWFRGALYFSFAYRSAVETAKALGDPKAAAQLARLSRAHVLMAQETGSYFFTGDQALQSLWITANDADKDGFESVNLYYRDPWMSNLILGSQALSYLTQAAQGDPEASIGRGIDGILDYFYMPALDVVRDLDPDYKKGVPPKTMYRILMAQYLAGNIPDVFQSLPGPMGANVPQSDAMYYIDRYDLEIRPPSKMVPGQPTFDGYQYRFQTKEGYNAFYLDSLALATIGAKRLANDATQVMILSGILPAGAEFGYLENGTPVMYLLGRETPMRLPKEWEMYDRQMRAQQNRLRELQKTFGEPVDTKTEQK